MAKKVLKNIAIGIVIALLVLYSTAFLFTFIMGRSLVTAGLEGLTRRNVDMASFFVTPPFTLHMNKLDIQGLAQVEKVAVSPALTSIFRGKLVLNSVKIIRPELTMEKNAAAEQSTVSVGVNNPAPAAGALQQSKTIPQSSSGGYNPAVIMKRLVVKDGKLHFIDHTAGQGGITINAEEIDFELRNTYAFPFSAVTNFKLSARIPWREGAQAGSVEASGWLNFAKKDMQAALNIRDIDGIYLYPYYSKWVDLEKARIQSAKLNFTSDIRGQNNEVTAKNHLELTDIVRRPRPAEEPEDKAEKITDIVLEAFRGLGGGKIELNFTVRTKMDRPQFGLNFIKSAFENKLAMARGSKGFGPGEVAVFPARLVGGTVKGAAGFSKALLQGTLVFGKEIKKSVESSFKKPKPDPAVAEHVVVDPPTAAPSAAAAPVTAPATAPAQEEEKKE